MSSKSDIVNTKFIKPLDSTINVSGECVDQIVKNINKIEVNGIEETSNMSTGVSITIEPLSRDNYDVWKVLMKAVLIKHSLWGFVNGTLPCPREAEEKVKWQEKDEKAHSDIVLGIGTNEIGIAADTKTSHELWKKIEDEFQAQRPALKACLLKQFLYGKMTETTDINDHLKQFFKNLQSLKVMNINFSDDVVAIVLLYSLPPSLDTFRCAIEANSTFPKPEELKMKIMDEFRARHSITDSNASMASQEAYQVRQNYSNFRGRGNRARTFQNYSTRNQNLASRNTDQQYQNNQNVGVSNRGFSVNQRGSFRGAQQGRPQSRRTQDFTCYYCHKPNHQEWQCIQKLFDEQMGNTARHTQEEEGGEGEETEEEHGLLTTEKEMSANVTTLNTTSKSAEEWCIDSGATSHMCHDLSKFEEMRPIQNQKVTLADDKSTNIEGKGTVVIKIQHKNKINSLRLENTLYVPDLNANLLSVSKSAANGKPIIFGDTEAFIVRKDTGQTIASAKCHGGLYFMSTIHESSAFAKQEKATIMDWHCRYGHLNESDLNNLMKREMVNGFKIIGHKNLPDCEICIKGKQTAIPVPKVSEDRKTKLLDLIHSDICGPINCVSLGGARYFATFIDDKSRWVKVYMLKTKDEVKTAFLKYKNEMECQKERKIKILRTDNGLEYVETSFDKELEKCGIRREKTMAHTPQQNGVAERMNRTLVEMALCLLLQSGLSLNFWAEAINTAVYLRNRCPTRPLKNKTPYEVWTGNKPNVSHFQTFGHKAYVLNKNPAQKKFDVKSQECIFIGYSEESKGYRLWNPRTRKIIKSRDVRFLNKISTIGENTPELERITRGSFNINLLDENTQDDEPNENPVHPNEVTPRRGRKRTRASESDGTDEDVDVDIQQTMKKGPGRPTLVRSGQRGRPRKKFNMIPTTPEQLQLAFEDIEISVEEALAGPQAKEWMEAMVTEFESLEDRGVFELMKCPTGRTPIGCKWILKTKRNSDGTIERHKARLVAKGYSQRFGVDFNETFAPVARLESLRLVTAIAAEEKMDLYQLDITMAYIYGDLNEEIYMKQADYFVKPDKENYVYKLKKSLYGLKQSGRQWFQKLHEALIELGLQQMNFDPCVYFKVDGSDKLYLIVYVDDLIFATSNHQFYKRIQIQLNKKFKMRDLGRLNYCLGLEFTQDTTNKSVHIRQEKYIKDLVKRFRLDDAYPTLTPLEPKVKLTKEDKSPDFDKTLYQSLIGSLMYAAVGTRPDIMYAVSALSSFCQNPKINHWNSAKRVLRYLKGTADFGLTFESTNEPLYGFTDADWGGDKDTGKSRTGYVFQLAGGAVSWASKRQQTTALSSTEAEYMSLTEAAKEAIYLRRFLHESPIICREIKPTTIYCDNQSAGKLVKNPIYHARTKHIAIRYHFVRDAYENKEIEIIYLPTNSMTADVLTKSLCSPNHLKFVDCLGLTSYRIKLNENH